MIIKILNKIFFKKAFTLMEEFCHQVLDGDKSPGKSKSRS